MEEDYIDYEELGERMADEYRRNLDLDKELGNVIYKIGSLVPGYTSLYGLMNKPNYGLYDAFLDLQDDIVPGAIQYRNWNETGELPSAGDLGLAMFAAIPAPGAKRAAKIANEQVEKRVARGKIAKPHAPKKFDDSKFSSNEAYPRIREAIDARIAQFEPHNYENVPLNQLGAEDALDAALIRHDASNYSDVLKWLRNDIHNIFKDGTWGLKYHHPELGDTRKQWLVKDDDGVWHDIVDEDFRARVFDILEQASPGYKKAAARQGVRQMLSRTPTATAVPTPAPVEGKRVIKATFDPSKLKK